jgi:hypothetical protein
MLFTYKLIDRHYLLLGEHILLETIAYHCIRPTAGIALGFSDVWKGEKRGWHDWYNEHQDD